MTSRRLAAALLVPLLACGPTRADTASAMPGTARVGQWTSGADGFHTTTWWVETADSVVVFGAQFTPALAEQALAEIRTQTDLPVRHVVVLHPNPDKANGAPVFQAAGAELVMSEASAAALPGVHAYKEAYFVGAGVFEAGGYPAEPVADRTFSGRLVLDTDPPIVLTELSASGVSSTQTVALVDGHAFVGDLVGGRVHAWLEGGIVQGAPDPDVAAWRAALDETLDLVGPAALVHPGRGAALPAGEILPEMSDYLGTAEQLVDAWLAEMDDPSAVLGSPDAGAAYAELTADFEQAFPGWQHSYLITYGAYGLAMQRATP